MSKQKFKFPKGTTKISAKEMTEALCNYETVEVPGTVRKVHVDMEEEDRKYIAKELILHEGTSELRFGYSTQNIQYNVPESVREIRCWYHYSDDKSKGFQAPKVLCLNDDFQYAGGLRGVEYLQHHNSSCVAMSRFRNLKHYVYLGSTINQKGGQFEDLTPGAVIHVENEKVAKSMLKRCNIFDNYVVVDALEWKDFPADKLALTMEEYDPESRILPLQKKMREEKLHEKAEKERKEQEEERQKQKDKMMTSMTKPIIMGALEPLCDSCTISKVDNDKQTVTISVSLDAIKWFDHRDRLVGTRLEISSSMDNIAENAQKMAKVLSELKDFFQRYAGDMERLEMRMQESVNTWMHVDWNILLATRCQGISITAIVKRDNIVEDSKVFTTFTEELDSILTHAKYDENINVKIGTE